MTTAGIIDAVSIAAVTGLAVFGAWRGLLKTLAGIVVLAAAAAGAWYIASHYAASAAHWAMPMVEEQITARLEEAMPSGGELDSAEFVRLPQMPELLERFGLKTENIELLMDQIREKLGTTVANASDELSNYAGMTMEKVLEELLTFFLFRVLLILSFFLLTVLLKSLVKILDRTFDAIPIVNTINAVGGGLFGLAEGVLLLVAVLLLAGFFGYTIDRPPLVETHVLRYLSDYMAFLGFGV